MSILVIVDYRGNVIKTYENAPSDIDRGDTISLENFDDIKFPITEIQELRRNVFQVAQTIFYPESATKLVILKARPEPEPAETEPEREKTAV